jgi:hypothetical protein
VPELTAFQAQVLSALRVYPRESPDAFVEAYVVRVPEREPSAVGLALAALAAKGMVDRQDLGYMSRWRPHV